MHKAAWGIALALAIFAAAWFYRGDSEVAQEKRVMMERGTLHDPQKQSADAVLSIKPGLPMRAGAPEKARLSPLMEQFLEAKSFRQIFDRLTSASQRTAEENWVLAQLLDTCAKVTDRTPPPPDASGPFRLKGEEARNRFAASISDKDPNRAKRIAAYDSIRLDRCGDIRATATTTNAEIDALRKDAVSRGDPKARIWSARDLPGSARFGVIKEVMGSGDPIAMETAGAYLAFFTSEDFSLRAGAQELPVDNEALNSAVRLLACDFGRPCGQESGAMAWPCASRGQCDAQTLREYVFFYQNSPSQSQLIAEYHHALTRAARESDWSYFTVHNGPAPLGAIFGPPPPPKAPPAR